MVQLEALAVKVLNRHEDLAIPLSLIGLLSVVVISFVEQGRLLLIDLLHPGLLIRNIIINFKLLGFTIFFKFN